MSCEKFLLSWYYISTNRPNPRRKEPFMMGIRSMNMMKRIMYRENVFLRQKENRSSSFLAVVTLLLFLAIAVLLRGGFEEKTVAIQTGYQTFGTVLLQDARGYVLVGILAFSVGVLFTITCQKTGFLLFCRENFYKNKNASVYNLILMLCFQYLLCYLVKSELIRRRKISDRQIVSVSGHLNEVVSRFNREQLLKSTNFAIRKVEL